MAGVRLTLMLLKVRTALSGSIQNTSSADGGRVVTGSCSSTPTQARCSSLAKDHGLDGVIQHGLIELFGVPLRRPLLGLLCTTMRILHVVHAAGHGLDCQPRYLLFSAVICMLPCSQVAFAVARVKSRDLEHRPLLVQPSILVLRSVVRVSELLAGGEAGDLPSVHRRRPPDVVLHSLEHNWQLRRDALRAGAELVPTDHQVVHRTPC